MGKHSIPDRWLNYTPIGKQIQGTRFIAFKVPLRNEVNESVEDETMRLDVKLLFQSIPNLGLIIDLTNTKKYYHPIDVIRNGVKYVKLMIPGQQIPSPKQTILFSQHVKNFLATNVNNDKLIGVHCTHGVNRTGYFICHHMVIYLKMNPKDAIQYFETARGHKIERYNYRNKLEGLNFDQNSKESLYKREQDKIISIPNFESVRKTNFNFNYVPPIEISTLLGNNEFTKSFRDACIEKRHSENHGNKSHKNVSETWRSNWRARSPEIVKRPAIRGRSHDQKNIKISEQNTDKYFETKSTFRDKRSYKSRGSDHNDRISKYKSQRRPGIPDNGNSKCSNNPEVTFLQEQDYNQTKSRFKYDSRSDNRKYERNNRPINKYRTSPYYGGESSNWKQVSREGRSSSKEANNQRSVMDNAYHDQVHSPSYSYKRRIQ